MKRLAVFTTWVLAAGLAFSTGALAADTKSPGQDRAVSENQRDQVGIGSQQQTQAGLSQQQQLKAVDDLEGFTVQNRQGERLGEVSELLVDMQQGKIGYAVIKSGGILGMGEQELIVPFSAFQLDQQQNILTLDMDKERLKQAPRSDVQAMDQQTGRQIHQFYGVSPYWEESGQQQQQILQRDQLQKDQIQERDQIQQKQQ